MRAARETRPYLSARGAAALRARLSDRDLAIVRQVVSLRLMSAAQLQAVHFAGEHGGATSMIRTRQRVIARLIRDGLLVSLRRRVGGVRAGSQGVIVAPGPAARRVLRLSGPRQRSHEPGERFVEHTLAISQLVVDVMRAAREGQLDLLDWQVEPQRRLMGLGGTQVLRPDAFLSLGVGAYALDWFCEIDRDTESVPTVLRKCRLYLAHYQSGAEQAEPERGGVFPRVCWIVPDEVRAERLQRAIAGGQFPERLFVVTTQAQALGTLTEIE